MSSARVIRMISWLSLLMLLLTFPLRESPSRDLMGSRPARMPRRRVGRQSPPPRGPRNAPAAVARFYPKPKTCTLGKTMVPSKAICAPAQESDRNRNHSPLPGAERVPHFLLDTGGAGGGNTQSSPEGANYLSPGQRPISAKIRKALQPGFSPTIALCQGGRDLIPIGHDGLQRYSGRDRCR